MRRAKIFLLVALALINLPVNVVMAENEVQPAIDLERSVEILEGGLLFINDTFTLKGSREDSLQIDKLFTGFQTSFIEERRIFKRLEGETWESIGFKVATTENTGLRGYVVELPYPVALQEGETLKIHASYVFIDLVKGAPQGFEATVPVYPALTYNISSFHFALRLPYNAELSNATSTLNFTESFDEGYWRLEYEGEDIKPLTVENATILYAPDRQDEHLLDCEELIRRVSIRPNGLGAEDEYTLVNLGNAISSLRLKLPAEASKITASDSVGPIKVEVAENDVDKIDVYVSPRSTLRAGDRWSFTVSYSLPNTRYVVRDGGESVLTYPLYGFTSYVHDLKAVIIIEAGGRLTDSEPEPSSVNQIGLRQEAVFSYGDRLPLDSPGVVVRFKHSAFWSVNRPAALLIIAAGALGSVIIFRKREYFKGKKRERPQMRAIEESLLSSLLDGYSQRTSLLLETVVIQQEFEENKISRAQFEQRLAEANKKLQEMPQPLKELERSVRSEDMGLEDKIIELRKAEDELDGVNLDLRNLEVRYRARRMSRRDFKRRKRERINRRRSAITRIKELVESLR